MMVLMKKVKNIKFDEKTYEAIEVTLKVTTEEPVSSSVGAKMKTEQVTTYAKGIGMVEMTSTIKIGKETYRSVIKLDKFKPVKSS